MNRRRWIAAAAVLLLLFAVGAVVVLASTGRHDSPAVEDCDAEDYANRERECGFAPSRAPTAKATKKK